MKNYMRFASDFQRFLLSHKMELPFVLENVGKPSTEFETNIALGLIKAHLFEISDDIKRLLVLTHTPKQNDMFRLPFPVIFIDVEFKKKELQDLGIDIGYDGIVGMLIGERKIILDTDKKEIGYSLSISICSMKDGQFYAFDTYAEEMNFYDEYKLLTDKVKYTQEEGLDKKTRRFVKMFVLNFLNFINNPEVSYVTAKHNEARDDKRMAKGRFPIPTRSVIRLSGTLKRYTEELKANPMWHYNYRFWCRGHFRTLKNPLYGKNVGKRIWIFPYIKGKGLLIEKTYLIDTAEVDDV